jgi:hypothetical protein
VIGPGIFLFLRDLHWHTFFCSTTYPAFGNNDYILYVYKLHIKQGIWPGDASSISTPSFIWALDMRSWWSKLQRDKKQLKSFLADNRNKSNIS